MKTTIYKIRYPRTFSFFTWIHAFILIAIGGFLCNLAIRPEIWNPLVENTDEMIPLAKIVRQNEKIRVKHAPSSGWSEPPHPESLENLDEIETAMGTTAEIKLSSGAHVLILQDSQLRLRASDVENPNTENRLKTP